MSDSPFTKPTMQCSSCGKPPHEGYCYPVLDGFLIVVLSIIVLFVGLCVTVILLA